MNTKLLRQKILDLAIRGKLTEQKKSDGTTKDLLVSIAASSACHSERSAKGAKSSRVILSKRSASKDLAKEIIPLDKSEAPFEIPENWEWVRLGDVVINRDAERKPVSKKDRNLHSLKIYDYYGAAGVIDKVEEFLFDEPLLLIGEDGANLLSRSKPNALIAEGQYWVNNHAHVIDAFDKSMLFYIALYINAISLDDFVTGTAQPKLNQENLNKIPVPLPPLAEQQRIATAIENAFAEITEIENNQELLKKHIKQGRQKILDLAIRGKLTQQLKTDGTTKDLLKQIQDERTGEALQTRDTSTCHCEAQKRRGNLKQSKSAFSKEIIPLDKTTAPFEIPSTWEWVKLGDICGYGDCDNVDVKKIENDAWILELEDIEKDSGKIIQHFAKSERAINGVRHSFKKGDILYSKLRTYLNKVLVAPEDGFCTTEIMPIKTKEISSAYLCLVLRSQYFLDYTTMCGYGVKMPRLSTADAKNGLIPLPPLAEQQRIVVTIEQAFAEFNAMEKGTI